MRLLAGLACHGAARRPHTRNGMECTFDVAEPFAYHAIQSGAMEPTWSKMSLGRWGI
jgi:hypothetical protein